MSATMGHAALADLAGQVSGSVLGPQDVGYEAARAVHNGLVDRKPALIVRCRTRNDVVAALAFARSAGLEGSIRGGGHNAAGRAVTDGGVMIDLAEMRGIAIDPDRATATARETAVPHREEGWNVLIPSVWTDAADTQANITWTRETFAAMRRHLGTGRWLNYLGDDQAEDAVRAAYGPNYDRLSQVKRRYDPDNVFHLNHNITP